MLGLAIESADRVASAALWRSDVDARGKTDAQGLIIDSDLLSKTEGKADQLILIIERMLQRQNLDYRHLDVIAVNRGPGSFTGIRSAVALGRGLALAADRPIVGLTSHEILAAMLETDEAERPLLIAFDARRGEVYTQTFGADGRQRSDIEARPPSAVADELASGSWRIAGHGAYLICQALDDSAKVELIEARPIDAVALAQAAARYLSAGRAPAKGVDLCPLYVRAPDAIPPAPLISATKDSGVSA